MSWPRALAPDRRPRLPLLVDLDEVVEEADHAQARHEEQDEQRRRRWGRDWPTAGWPGGPRHIRGGGGDHDDRAAHGGRALSCRSGPGGPPRGCSGRSHAARTAGSRGVPNIETRRRDRRGDDDVSPGVTPKEGFGDLLQPGGPGSLDQHDVSRCEAAAPVRRTAAATSRAWIAPGAPAMIWSAFSPTTTRAARPAPRPGGRPPLVQLGRVVAEFAQGGHDRELPAVARPGRGGRRRRRASSRGWRCRRR